MFRTHWGQSKAGSVFKTFLKDKEKIVNTLQLPYSNAKLEATNNLIKLIKRNAFGFLNFENFNTLLKSKSNLGRQRLVVDLLLTYQYYLQPQKRILIYL